MAVMDGCEAKYKTPVPEDRICPKCGKHHEFEEMDGDHIIPWWRGGKTTLDNLQMLCKPCNSGKGGKME